MFQDTEKSFIYSTFMACLFEAKAGLQKANIVYKYVITYLCSCLTLQGEITGDAAADNDGEGQDGDKNGVVGTRKASSLASTDLSVFNSPAASEGEQHTINDDIINAVDDAKNAGKVHHKAFSSDLVFVQHNFCPNVNDQLFLKLTNATRHHEHLQGLSRLLLV